MRTRETEREGELGGVKERTKRGGREVAKAGREDRRKIDGGRLRESVRGVWSANK